jgi:hypothetical protein
MRSRPIAAAAVLAVALVAGGAMPASADSGDHAQPGNIVQPGNIAQPGDIAQSAVVSANPVDWTPHVLNGTVWSMAVVGDTVIVGGSFTAVADSSRRHTYARRNMFAYDLHDGTVRSFDPDVDGTVYALATGPDDTVYAGGAFTEVNGDDQRGLARLDLDGDRVGGFRAQIGRGQVQTLGERDGWLYAGGTFASIDGQERDGLARVDARSGALDRRFDARLTSPGLRRTLVESLDISPDGQRMVVVGSYMKSNGTDRAQIAMFDIGGSGAALDGWYTNAFTVRCAPDFEAYVRQVKFSPDGSYIVTAQTGGTSDPDKPCDAAARFQASGSGRHDPVWVQRTGGNTLTAVAITGVAVYLGGHQLYMDNPYGHKVKNVGQPAVFTPGPGAVVRPGIAAVDPATGKALSWNPTRARGVGVHAFVTVSRGLLVGSDTDELGHEYHGRIGMFPLA